MINDDFEPHWLTDIFPMFPPVMEFDDCSELGLQFF